MGGLDQEYLPRPQWLGRPAAAGSVWCLPQPGRRAGVAPLAAGRAGLVGRRARLRWLAGRRRSRPLMGLARLLACARPARHAHPLLVRADYPTRRRYLCRHDVCLHLEGPLRPGRHLEGPPVHRQVNRN